jgi:hypothetical protein
MKYPIKINPNCHNQVETINGSVVCGVYQIINGIKHIWLCDKCHNSPMEIEDEKLTSSIREEKLIRKLKEAFCDSKRCLHNWQTVLDCKNSTCSCRIIDEIFGDKLTKEQEQEK